MQQHQIANEQEADQFFYCRGAVTFFDFYYPIDLQGRPGKIHSRNYFDVQKRQVGYFSPPMPGLYHPEIKHFEEPFNWESRPELKTIDVDLIEAI